MSASLLLILLLDFGITVGLYLGQSDAASFIEGEWTDYAFTTSMLDLFVICLLRPAVMVIMLISNKRPTWHVNVAMPLFLAFVIAKCSYFFTTNDQRKSEFWRDSNIDILFTFYQVSISWIEYFGCKWTTDETRVHSRHRLLGSERTVVITGGSSALGASLARVFSRNGYRIVLLARTKSAIDSVVAEIVAVGGSARAFTVDLSDPSAVSTVTNRILVEFGIPDVVINAATTKLLKSVEDTTPVEIMSTMSVPYFSAFYVIHSFLPCMLERGYGCIININSMAGYIPCADAAAYSCSQYAVRNLHQVLQLNTQDTNLLVMEVVLGRLRRTKKMGVEDMMPEIFHRLPEITPEEAAECIFRGLVHGESFVIAPFWQMSFLMQMNRFFPSFVQSVLKAEKANPASNSSMGPSNRLGSSPAWVNHSSRRTIVGGGSTYYAPSIN
eukprot:TRINITY_DN11337_c0_g1_i1.p1 TRINITY_DN11337_c0_g1~~TRINITY_DN11337_c0_g1_i1.p1  ORF type:complete len:441 (+),score=69.82 TRINITY_DN11337_c0_g1_i1:69-1391(+)